MQTRDKTISDWCTDHPWIEPPTFDLYTNSILDVDSESRPQDSTLRYKNSLLKYLCTYTSNTHEHPVRRIVSGKVKLD